MDFTVYFDDFCKENGLNVDLSYNMPEGYENAYGTFDVVGNTLFINRGLLENSPEYEVLFYLFHELRHVLQYKKTCLFDEKIRKSLDYVVLYNGTCFRLVGKEWKSCVIVGDEEYFTEIYLNLPYERDANEFAYHKIKSILGGSRVLDDIYSLWKPKNEMDFVDIEKLFAVIDKMI